MLANVEALTGSPVDVTITNYTSGSVVATTMVDFLDNSQTSAATYSTVMQSGDPALVFGTSYGSVTVDPSSVVTSQVTNPSGIYGLCMSSVQCIAFFSLCATCAYNRNNTKSVVLQIPYTANVP